MKKIFAIIIVFLIFGAVSTTGAGCISNALEAGNTEIKLFIEGQEVPFSRTDGLGFPFIENERTLVPLRKPLEAIGASVNYEPASRTVAIRKDGTEITIVVDGGMFVNGSAYSQVAAPTAATVIKDGRVYVSIRTVFEVLGYSVSWNGETKTINIEKTGLPIETVKGWSVPSPAAGATGLGMTDIIGALSELPSYIRYNNVLDLNDPEQVDELNTIGVGLRNFSEDEPVRLDSVTFEYQVYQKIMGKEVLVYHETFLPFEGTLPALSGTVTNCEVQFWNSKTTAPGEYVIRFSHPEYFTGINIKSGKEIKIPINQNFFGESVELIVKE